MTTERPGDMANYWCWKLEWVFITSWTCLTGSSGKFSDTARTTHNLHEFAMRVVGGSRWFETRAGKKRCRMTGMDGGMGRQAWCHRQWSVSPPPSRRWPFARRRDPAMDRAGPRPEQKVAARSNRQQTPRTVAHRPTPPTAIPRLCCSDTITINYCWTPCRGNQAFVSSYVGGGDRTPRLRAWPPVRPSSSFALLVALCS